MGYIVGLIGCWMVADSVASLYTYTGNNEKAKGQEFWRDHSLRILRGVLGVTLMVIGGQKCRTKKR